MTTTTSLESCCTCATILSPPSYSHPTTPSISSKSASISSSNSPSATRSKPTADDPPSYSAVLPHTHPSTLNGSLPSSPPRHLPCCHRLVCGPCLAQNPRFTTYCPFCQVSSTPTALPQGGLRDPPGYESIGEAPKTRTQTGPNGDAKDTIAAADTSPPSYESLAPAHKSGSDAGSTAPARPDVIHHLHGRDTMTSLSLAYGVPASVLRRHNEIFSDTLLAGRRTVAIPGTHYAGESLSGTPVESAEEAERKRRIRGFMMRTKCHEYELAELYLASVGGDVESAVERWKGDERWERENPLEGARRKGNGKDKNKRGTRAGGIGGGLTGQLR